MDKRRKHMIKEIFKDHWDTFYEEHKSEIKPVVKQEVKKMFKCIDIQHVYTEYRCNGCG